MTSQESPAEVVETIERYLEVAELGEIVTMRVVGERIFPNSDEAPAEAPAEGDDGPVLHAFHRADNRVFEVRCVSVHHSPAARILADVAVFFAHSIDIVVTPEVQQEVAEKIGVMAAYPYLREIFQSTAARLGVNVPVVGLIRAGQFDVEQVPGLSNPAEIPSTVEDATEPPDSNSD